MRVGELSGSLVYLDANILIYAIEDSHPNSALLMKLLSLVDQGLVRAVTSQLTLAEVLVQPYIEQNEILIRQYSTILGPQSAIEAVSISSEILDRAARLRAVHRLKLLDAIHLATAVQRGCDRMVTNDDDLAAAAGEHMHPIDILTLLP